VQHLVAAAAATAAAAAAAAAAARYHAVLSGLHVVWLTASAPTDILTTQVTLTHAMHFVVVLA
jgi:hypothetical protein